MLIEARITALIAILAYASYRDIKTREVSNKLWILAVAVAFLLLPFANLAYVLLSLAIAIPCGLAMFTSGAYGSADIKAIFVIALLMPETPWITPTHPLFAGVFVLSVIFYNLTLSLIEIASMQHVYGCFTGKRINSQDNYPPAMPLILLSVIMALLL